MPVFPSGLGIYDITRDNILRGTVGNLVTMTSLQGALVCSSGGTPGTTQYNPLQDLDTFFSTIPGSATNSAGSVFAGAFNSTVVLGAARTSSAGALFITGNSVAFTSVAAVGLLPATAFVIWIKGAATGSSPLVAFIDFNNWNPANGVVPAGSTITFTFSASSPGVFKI